ncbi:hypothetical protein EH240_12690 [Mesorhizobium tamadayense]|uniref:Uncharacterized protein n=1 Tax=Mesorhizobium tamadayense TaxID=425306 RepID=A0A3P3FV32_9HYPH|nr:hypothetical protein [Mesorhizobium tamadayense]RRI02317.1 hypothetical protein EH240_12690 [Mesorhizobium tamadayense]
MTHERDDTERSTADIIQLERHEPDYRPVVRLEAGLYTQLAERIERAIHAKRLPLYVGAVGLVYPAGRNVETAEEVSITVTQLVPVTTPVMLQFMDQATRFERYDRRSSQWLAVKPPRDIAELIIARRGFWPFPEVHGVIAAPTIGADGNFVSKDGVDAKSKLLLAGAPVVEMAKLPTREDALAGLEVLEGLLAEYQFSDESSRSVALSMLITPLMRGLVPLAPLHCVSAPVAGSGKSYLASLASGIATGRYCPVIPPANKEEEFEKRLIGAMLAGMPIVSFDNVNGVLDSSTLCQALEQRIIEVRPLGTSTLCTVEQRMTWLANGNNIQIAQDLTRRSIMCRVDRNEERPELHEYDERPFEQVIRNRAKYIAAALTIVRAYIVAGRPGKLAPLASYEQWSDSVRSALVWLGCADPCETMLAVRASDGRLQQLGTLFAAWASSLGLGMEYPAKQVITVAHSRKTGSGGPHGEPAMEPDSQLWDAIYECCGAKGAIEPKALGNFLKNVVDRVVTLDLGEGKSVLVKMIKSDEMHRDNVARWILKML